MKNFLRTHWLEFLEDARMLFPRVPEWLYNLAKRLHGIIAAHKQEGSEVINAFLALCWIFPLAVNPNYLQTSPYLRQIAERMNRYECLAIFLVLFTYWGFCVSFGGKPSSLIKSDGQLAGWTRARRAGLMLAVFVWFEVAQLLTMQGVNAGTGFYFGFAAWNAYLSLRLSWNTIKEREKLWRENRTLGRKSRKDALKILGR